MDQKLSQTEIYYKDSRNDFYDDETISQKINSQAAKENKIAELWVTGIEYDWNKFYGKNKPRKISLPTYPFARDRYWLSKTEKSDEEKNDDFVIRLHPLLHKNTSDLSIQKYSSTFTGKEFFFADHIQPGRCINSS